MMDYPRYVFRPGRGALDMLLVTDDVTYQEAIDVGWYSSSADAANAAPIGSGLPKELVQIMADEYTNATGAAYTFEALDKSVRHVTVTIDGTGAISADVTIQRANSLHEGGWTDEYTVEMSGTNSASWGGTQIDTGGIYRAKVSSISGTNAHINVWFEK